MNKLVTPAYNLCTKAALEILVQHAHNFDKNLKTLNSKLVTNNDFYHKSYDVRCVLTY